MAGTRAATTYNLPHYKRLTKNEPNISSDDPPQKAAPQKIGAGVEVARKLMRGNPPARTQRSTSLSSFANTRGGVVMLGGLVGW